MAMMASSDGGHPQGSRPVFQVVSAGLDPRDLKLIGIVFLHSRYNRYDFRLLQDLDLNQADILLVDPLDPAGLRAILAAGSAARRITTVSAVPRGVQPTARYSFAMDQLTTQLLPVLNRLVQAESLEAEIAAEKAAAGVIAAAARPVPGDHLHPSASLDCQATNGQFHQALPRARLQVVVADPSVPAQQQLTRALRRMGLAVHCVAGAADALHRLKAQHTDLVITESGLSDSDGFELIRSVRSQPGHRYTPVLLLRSRLHPMDATRARLAGGVTLLTKPLTRQALEMVVRQALRKSVVFDDLNELLSPG
ncbi:MAG: response regulator [Lautropia sp.]|nr:response regulator [Lautropia sp.]